MKDEPAFPCQDLNPHEPLEVGLTKREYFAALAMQGFIAMNQPSEDRGKEAPEILAKAGVACADALIKALQKGGEGE